MGIPAIDGDNLMWWPGRGTPYSETWYLTGCIPERRQAFWIRYTLWVPTPGVWKSAKASVWFFWFDRGDPTRNIAARSSVPLEKVDGGHSSPFRLRIGEAELTSVSTHGQIEHSGGPVAWDLVWVPPLTTYQHVPWTLRLTGVVKSRICSPNLICGFAGSITVHGEKIRLTHAPGHQSHLGGPGQANEWAWAHCSAFTEDPGAVLELLTAKVTMLGQGLPDLTSIHLKTKGRMYRLNGVNDLHRPENRISPTSWSVFTTVGKKGAESIRIDLSARAADLIGVEYRSPSDIPRWCYNSEVASCRVTIERADPLAPGGTRILERLSSDGTTAFETGRPQRLEGQPIHLPWAVSESGAPTVSAS